MRLVQKALMYHVKNGSIDITERLQRWQTGDQQALNDLMPIIYTELKKLAAAYLRREGRSRPLDTTALVHEAFLRLASSRQPSYENRSHFYGIASRLMRQVLVDLARARSRGKRSALEHMPFVDCADLENGSAESILVMDQTLERLARTDALKVQLLEMRFFGGMTAEESAAALSLSVHVVRRELRLAQAWLRKEMMQ